MDLNIHLNCSDSLVGSCHLEVHIAEEILQSLDIRKHEIIIVRIPCHKSCRNTCHSRLNRYACRHQGHRRSTHTRLGCGTIGLKGLRYRTDRIRKLCLVWKHRHQSALCQSTVPDLAASRTSGRSCLADRIGREIIVVHISLGCLRLIKPVQSLRLCKRCQSRNRTDLRLPSCKHCRAMNSWNQINLCCKRPDLVNGSSVRTLMIL